MSQEALQVFNVASLRSEVAGPEPRYFEFLGGERLTGGLYRLPAGSHDLQTPHLEDEVYFVLEGSARIRSGDVVRDVKPGMVLFIRANARHAFIEISEDLTLLAVFSAATDA
ncbi:MAG: cupin domain-containing protein [Gammaproteobacteria bacterium]|nr:cupin domain-containing protein [Gammaproteobacteria bacterium]